MRTVDWKALIPPWLDSTLLHGVLITDAALTVRIWNDWMERRSGRPAAQVLGRALPDLAPELTRPDLIDCFSRALAGEQIALDGRRFPYLLKMPAPGRPDLPYMPQEVRIGPVTLDGQIVGAVATVADRSGEAPARIPLETVFQLLDTALAQAPVGFGVLDNELRFRVVNARLAEQNGQPAAAHLGKTFRELFPDWGDRLEPFFRRALAGQPTIAVPFSGGRHARPDEIAHWQASYFPIELADGRRIGVGALIEDITEQKRAEVAKSFLAELGTSLSQSLDYWATLQRLASLSVPELADWCAIDMLGEGERFSAFAHSDPQQAARAEQLQRRSPLLSARAGPIEGSLSSGRPLLITNVSQAVLDTIITDKAQLSLLHELRPGSCIIVPLSSDGEVAGAMILARNAERQAFTRADLSLAEEIARRAITTLENVRLYVAAQHSRALAENAVRVRDAFFSIAAHELRTPLTTLLGRSQMLQRWLDQPAPANERSRRTIQIIVAQAQRLNRMITALLDVSRIQTGRFSIDPTPMDLTDLARRVVDESQLTIVDRTITLHTPDAPLAINGDEVRLEQMLQNLIGNAIKYSPNGGPIEVRLSRQDGQALLTVSDEGIGISEAAQRQLFRRFYRAENAEAYGISGMGIGLFVVKEIAELHGGEVSVRSAEGQGSAFSVRLPLKPTP